jgi:hypothetical protein
MRWHVIRHQDQLSRSTIAYGEERQKKRHTYVPRDPQLTDFNQLGTFRDFNDLINRLKLHADR